MNSFSSFLIFRPLPACLSRQRPPWKRQESARLPEKTKPPATPESQRASIFSRGHFPACLHGGQEECHVYARMRAPAGQRASAKGSRPASAWRPPQGDRWPAHWSHSPPQKTPRSRASPRHGTCDVAEGMLLRGRQPSIIACSSEAGKTSSGFVQPPCRKPACALTAAWRRV